MITNHQRHRQTDGQTDRRTTCDPKTAHMHLSALRGKTRSTQRAQISAERQHNRRRGRRGSGMVSFERALVSFYRPSIVSFPLSLRVLKILPLLFSSTPLFPYPPLSKFPHVSLGVGGSPFGYKERRCWANCPCN